MELIGRANAASWKGPTIDPRVIHPRSPCHQENTLQVPSMYAKPGQWWGIMSNKVKWVHCAKNRKSYILMTVSNTVSWNTPDTLMTWWISKINYAELMKQRAFPRNTDLLIISLQFTPLEDSLRGIGLCIPLIICQMYHHRLRYRIINITFQCHFSRGKIQRTTSVTVNNNTNR